MNQSALDEKFQSSLNQYSQNLEALRDFISVLTAFLKQHEADIIKNRIGDLIPLGALIETILPELTKDANLESSDVPPKPNLVQRAAHLGEIIRDEEGGKGARFRFKDSKREQKSVEAITAFVLAIKKRDILAESSLLTLISQAEWFQSQILTIYISEKPGLLGLIGKPMSAADWKSLGSTDSIIADAVDKKVAGLMRDSLEDRLEFIRKSIEVTLDEIKPFETEIIEIHLRRNVLVHNGGIASAAYTSRVNKTKGTEITQETKLPVTAEYLIRAIDLCEIAFLCVAGDLWRKCQKESEARGRLLVQTASKALIDGRFAVAEALSRFVMGDDKSYKEPIRLMALINYWQSHKSRGDFSKVQSEITRFDFTAKALKFQVQQAALLGDSEKVLTAIPKLAADGAVTKNELQKSTIYEDLRRDTAFTGLIEQVFPSAAPPKPINRRDTSSGSAATPKKRRR